MSGALQWIPRAEYGDGQVLRLSLPQRPWSPSSAHIGGGNRAALGAREVYTIRRDELLECRIRFMESEWTAVRRWLLWAQESGQSFKWYSDADDAGWFTVSLESPAAGEPIRPERDGEVGHVYEITVTFRREEAGAFYEAYY